MSIDKASFLVLFHAKLRHETTRDVTVEDFLKVLGWRPRR